MVKLRGPLGSAEASGSFGPSTVFSSWKGRQYAKTKTIPFNPKSPMQTSARAMMTFLAQQWTALSAIHKATWDDLAAATGIPPYNAFLSANLERWGQFRAPTKLHPTTSAGSLPTATLESATGGKGFATLLLEIANDRDCWGVMLFRGHATPLITARENCIAIITTPEEGDFTYTDHALDPGTYYYNARYFTYRGYKGPQETQRSCTVT